MGDFRKAMDSRPELRDKVMDTARIAGRDEKGRQGVTADDTVRVQAPFSKREVEVSRAEWLACRRVENLAAVLALMVGSGLFIGGLRVSGLSPIGVLVVLCVAYIYFDGYVSRWCAARKAGR